MLQEFDQARPLGVSLAPGTRLVAGRGSTVDFALRDPGVSRRHFEVENHGDSLVLRDLGSKGGTLVNGTVVSQVDLGPGDRIEAGASRLVALQVQPLVPRLEKGALEVAHYGSGRMSNRVPLDRNLRVGRSAGCDIVIDNNRISRQHIEIQPNGTGAVVINLAPNNRAEVNGRALEGSRTLSPGDRIQLADIDEVLVVESPQASAGVVAIEVGAGEGSYAVEVDAGVDSTVGEVAERLGLFLGVSDAGSWTLLQPEAGVVLHPENLWADSGVRRGDRFLLLELGEIPGGSTHTVRYGPPRIALNQLPRSVTPPTVQPIRTPRPPESQSLRGRGVTWQIVGGLGIIVAGVLMVLINPNYAPFAMIGGLVGVISVTAGIMGEQSRRKHGVHKYRARIEELDTELDAIRVEQTRRLREVNPSPDEVVRWVSERSRRLWERRPADSDFLRLRLGAGVRYALINTDDQNLHSESPLVSELRDLIDRHRLLEDVPVLTSTPATAPIVGVVGSRRDVLEVASWLLVQATALHSPAELEVAIPAVNQDWLWSRWLPHLEAADGINLTWNESDALTLARKLATGIAKDANLSASRATASKLVVVPHGASQLLLDVMAQDSAGETLYLVLADRASDLPSRVDAVVTVQGDTATMEGPNEDGAIGPILIDRMTHEMARDVARAMGRYVDARKPPRRASGQLGLLDLLGVASPTEVDVGALWSSRMHAPLSAVVGTTLDDEPLVLGFRSDGVHGVVGGTTGSGKSEFLQTLLMSLALTHRPDQLSLFLIDFKGGATFASLAELPHIAGVVTDLEKDATLAHRAFTSLEAEMARRKTVLDAARVPGLVEYERLPESATNPLPALLVVIDEFALLVRQQPEVKERLDLVATQGRSLGVHLLLATQSPSNVITPSIRSNTQVWISLRVVDDSESTELLGHRDAARIPPDRPGRGFVRFGGSQSITGFQTARIARPVGGDARLSGVSIRPFADVTPDGAVPGQGEPPLPTGRIVTELEQVCSAVAEQSGRLGIRPANPLWLEPLPELLAAPTSSDGLIREPGHLSALVGLRDDPARHIQEPFSVDLGKAGNLLLVGTRGSGKSTALRQILVELAEQHSPADLHLYGIESGTGSLNSLGRMPHSAVMVPVGDRERLYRVLARLSRVMDERREMLAASGFADFQSWRRGAAVPEPWVVLAIDDYPAFKEVADGSGLGLLNDQLLSLCQGGPPVGIHVVLSSSQPSDMRMNLVNLFGSRILLRQVDAADYSLLELRLRPNELPPSIPGRALVAGGYEMQVFHSDEERIGRLVEAPVGETGAPEPIRRLPTEIQLGSLPSGPDIAPVIGVAGPEHQPFGLDLRRMEPHLVIAGEGRSGRSTALLTIFEAIRAWRPDASFLFFSPRPSPVRAAAMREDVTVATTPEEMLHLLGALPDIEEDKFLFIDDAESLPVEVGDQLERLLRDASQIGLRSFVTGRSTDLSRSFDGWVRYLLSLKSGLLLMPAPDGGFVFDVRLPATQMAMTPGRGFMCERGETTFVQIALPSGDQDRPASAATAEPGDDAGE